MISKLLKLKILPLLIISFSALVYPDKPEQLTLKGLQIEINALKKSLEGYEQGANKKEQSFFQAKYQDVSAKFGGKYTQEAFVGEYLTYLNQKIGNDSSFFIRTTVDYAMDFVYGDCQKPRIAFHDTLRFRYKWGSGTDVKVTDGVISLVDVKVDFKGTQANKHLLWSREAWLKIGLGNLDNEYNNFLQIGVFPFSVGRGISLGAAYRRSGFLGFTPGFEVDQYAPGALWHFDISPQVAFVDFYAALLENVNTSLKNNCEKIRLKEIDACPERGTGRQSFLAAFRASWNVIAEENQQLSVEPYIVYIDAPDQKLEFKNDTDSFLTTYGCAVEGAHGSVDWGFEAAVNDGCADIKPWDRNCITIAVDPETGCLIEQYNKVFTQDPATVNKPLSAAVTSSNKAVVSGSSKSVDLNGQEISSGSGLYNAYDRFRPRQKRLFGGYFLIADASWQVLEDELRLAIGAGYSSGDLNPQLNANEVSQDVLLNQEVRAFVPLQSVYSGKRLRHLILFNEGVPRFRDRNPNAQFVRQNATKSFSDESIEFTNIAFVGAKADWQIQSLRENKVSVAPNLICYWAPETPLIATGNQASNFMGTELVAEFSAVVYKKLKIYAYAGALFPGQYFKDMAGTVIDSSKSDFITGSDPAFIANIGMTYAF